MPNIPSIPELLQPLSSRLADIEGLRISPLEGKDFDPKAVLIPLERNIHVLKPEETMPAFAKMFAAIDQILGKKIPDYTVNSALNEFPFFGDEIEATTERITTELKFYQDILEDLHNKAQPIILVTPEPLLPVAQNRVIELPQGFTFEIVRKNFEPGYNVNQATLLFYFLRQEKIIPQYSDLSLSTIGTVLTGYSPNSFRQHLNRVQHFDKVQDDLKATKRLLERLLEAVEEEILPDDL